MATTADQLQNVKAGGLATSGEMRPISVSRHRIESLRATAGHTAPIENGNGTAEERCRTLTRSQELWDGGEFSILPPAVSTPPPSPSLYAVQEWEGCVVKIGEVEFEARLIDVTGGDTLAREVAAIPFEELSAEDRERIQVGSIFRWVIGYGRSVGGTRSNVSQIVFLDPPRLTARDIEEGRRWAE